MQLLRGKSLKVPVFIRNPISFHKISLIKIERMKIGRYFYLGNDEKVTLLDFMDDILFLSIRTTSFNFIKILTMNY